MFNRSNRFLCPLYGCESSPTAFQQKRRFLFNTFFKGAIEGTRIFWANHDEVEKRLHLGIADMACAPAQAVAEPLKKGADLAGFSVSTLHSANRV